MHRIILKFLTVFICSVFIFCADLSGSSVVSKTIVSGCWSGKTLKSLSEDRVVPACASTEFSALRTPVEMSFLDYSSKAALSGTCRVSRQNHDQVSALFMEEGNYAR
jgi:hypothetical protein